MREYWIIDPLVREGRFLRLNDDRRFIAHEKNIEGNYVTPILPGFVLHVPTMWRDPLPDVDKILDAVANMLNNT